MKSIFTALILLSNILWTYSSSRYFVYTLTVPLGDPKYVPFPLDKCVNYKISTSGILHMTINYDYAKFTCNGNNNKITMTTYGSDSTCTSSPGTIHNTYNASDFNEAGDLYSFNCIGEDNYAENHIYQSDDSCCGSSYTISFAATNVCVKNAADGTYSMGICNSNTTTSYKYNTSQCGTINDGIVQGTTYDYQCVSIMNQWTPIYTRMDKCILNGTIFDESKFCHTTTATPTLPTISPTYKPTISPTISPTNAPTTTMDAKLIGNISLMNILIIGAVIMILLMVGIAIYCFMKKKKIEKQNELNRVGLINGDYVEQQESIPMDNVVTNEDFIRNMVEQEYILQQESIAMDNVVTNEDDQVIVGTADEIAITNFNAPPR